MTSSNGSTTRARNGSYISCPPSADDDVTDNANDVTHECDNRLHKANGSFSNGDGHKTTMRPTKDIINSDPKQPLLKRKEDKIEVWPFLLINISLALINCSSRFHGPVMDQYVYQESARKILGNDTIVTTSQPCLHSNMSSLVNATIESLVIKAQHLASTTLLHLDLTSYGVGIFSNTILGAYSSVMNRKLLLFIPTFGFLMRNITIPVVIFWKLDFNWLFLGYGIDGLCGNASGIYFGSYLYTTDITSRSQKRTVGVAILHSLKGLVPAFLNIVTGHLIELSGVMLPSVISAACVLGSIITILFLPNRKPPMSRDGRGSSRSLSKALKSYLIPFNKDKGKGISRMLFLGYFSFFAILICHFGVTKVGNSPISLRL